MDLVSIVVPCYNPSAYLSEALASARNQTYTEIEIVLVNDGSDQLQSQIVLEQGAREADLYLSQPNCGLPSARNVGIRAAHGDYIVPLDADDLIQPEYVVACLDALKRSPDAAYAYTAYRVFGAQNRLEQPGEFNLYRLLDQNFLTYAALIRKEDWAQAGGYDESMRFGYEDWEFWLRLGALNRFGAYVPSPLFQYRKHGSSRYDLARSHHADIISYIHSKHPDVYAYEARASIKARWSPAVTVISRGPYEPQSILDIERRTLESGRSLNGGSLAPALLLSESGDLDCHSAEMAALAVWTGRTHWRLPDGSVTLSRKMAQELDNPEKALVDLPKPPRASVSPVPASRRHLLMRHLENAGLLRMDAWSKHPWRSILRLIPLRLRERINKAARREIFDLSYYLQFQPNSLVVDNSLIQPLCYFPQPLAGRSRIALITPHLGPGGAESVLLEVASSLGPTRFELLLLATQSRDNRWLSAWRDKAEHVYDIAALAPPERVSSTVFTIVSNWKCDAVLVQNSLAGYAALPHIKRARPQTKVVDLIHALDDRWDQISAIADVAPQIDLRIAACEVVRKRLLSSGAPIERIRLIRNGIDLSRFQAQSLRCAPPLRILFAGRLDPVKRPGLLVTIAAHLTALRTADFQFVIAGDGPESEVLRKNADRARLSSVFDFRGHVDDIAPLFASCDVLVLPSRAEGIPLVVLEALASSRPVVASNVGANSEILDPSCGALIDVVPDEAHLFAVALNALLCQPELREKMGAAGRRKIEAHYDVRATREAYIQTFADLLPALNIPKERWPSRSASPAPS